MKNPTIEEIKELYKNAKYIESIHTDYIFEIDHSKYIIAYNDNDVLRCYSKKNIKCDLYYKGKYAKIISYKNNYTLSEKEIKLAYENPNVLKEMFPELFTPELTIEEAEQKFNIKIKR